VGNNTLFSRLRLEKVVTLRRQLAQALGRVYRFLGVMNLDRPASIHNTHKAENPRPAKLAQDSVTRRVSAVAHLS